MRVQRLFIVLTFALAGCSAAKFSTNKQDFLSKASAFDNGDYQGTITQPNAAGNGITQPADDSGSASGSIHQPGMGGFAQGSIHQPDGTDDEVDFRLMCSDRRSGDAANFKKAVAENLPVQLLIDTKICTQDINIIKSLITKKSFTVADAQQICPALVPAEGKWSNVSLVIDSSPYNSMRGVITVLYALNHDTQPADEVADQLCDEMASPLVIHLDSDPTKPQPIALSSQADGVLFDLLGASDNHEYVRISWFTNHDYGFLALPDKNGDVNSIDQLFGNNTVGPDGLFADDGYAALAKYDGKTADGMFQVAKPDGFIDAKDPIYSRLRIWVDLNFDGVAQPNELVSLRRARIAYIDLGYSSDYAETDQYGNQTLMKSVVGHFDGSLDLIFDLWFAYEYGE